MDKSKLQNLSPWAKFQYVFTWYLLRMIRFVFDIVEVIHRGESVIEFVLEPLKNKVGSFGKINLYWIKTLTLIKVCIIFLFAPFLFVIRITTSIIWVSTKFGKVPSFVYTVSGVAFIYATWKTVTWIIDEYQQSTIKES